MSSIGDKKRRTTSVHLIVGGALIAAMIVGCVEYPLSTDGVRNKEQAIQIAKSECGNGDGRSQWQVKFEKGLWETRLVPAGPDKSCYLLLYIRAKDGLELDMMTYKYVKSVGGACTVCVGG
jgi:hypothetical protein